MISNRIFWKTIYINSKEADEVRLRYQSEFYSVLSGEYGYKFKKLQGVQLYSMRQKNRGDQKNQSDRLIFIKHPTLPNALVLVREADNHNYHGLQALEANHRNELEKSSDHLTPITLDEVKNENQQLEILPLKQKPLKQKFFFGCKPIALNATQSEAVHQALYGEQSIAIIGMAGSGKSCVIAAAQVEAAMESLAENNAKKIIIYVTETEKLAQEMQTKWNESPESQETHVNNEVLFFSYNGLLNYLDKNAKTKIRKDEDYCKKWIREHIRNNKSKWNTGLKINGEKIDIHTREWKTLFGNVDGIFQEFRRLAGYTKDEYCALTEKNDFNREQKSWIYDVYEAYCKHLIANDFIDPEFYQIKEEVALEWADKITFIGADEMQNASTQQLNLLSQITKRICFCLDSNQGLKDKEVFQLSYLTHTLKCAAISLPHSYRNDEYIIQLANFIVKLKNFLVGGLANNLEQQAISSESQTAPGQVQLLLEDEEIEDFIRLYQQKPHTIIITTLDKKEEAQAIFGKTRVFTIEEIEGLEYHEVICWKLSESELFKEIFKEANQLLGKVTLEKIMSETYNRAKYPKPHFRVPFNNFFTLITRAKHVFKLIDPGLKKHKNLLSLLSEVFPNQEVTIEKQAVNWLKEAKKLYNKGLRERALEIYNEENLLTNDERINFKNFTSTIDVANNIKEAHEFKKNSSQINERIEPSELKDNKKSNNNFTEKTKQSRKKQLQILRNPQGKAIIEPVEKQKNHNNSVIQKGKGQVLNQKQAPTSNKQKGSSNVAVEQKVQPVLTAQDEKLSKMLSGLYRNGDIGFTTRFAESIKDSLKNNNYRLIKRLIFDIPLNNHKTLFETLFEQNDKNKLSLNDFFISIASNDDLTYVLLEDILDRKLYGESAWIKILNTDAMFLIGIMLDNYKLRDFLLNHKKFNVNDGDSEGNTLLHHIITYQHVVDKKYFNKQVCLEQYDYTCKSILNLANTLIQNPNINFNIINKEHFDPCLYAASTNCLSIFKLLLPYYNEEIISDAFILSIMQSDMTLDLFYYLHNNHKHQIDVNKICFETSILHFAAIKSLLPVIKILCENYPVNLMLKASNAKLVNAPFLCTPIELVNRAIKCSDNVETERDCKEILQYLIQIKNKKITDLKNEYGLTDLNPKSLAAGLRNAADNNHIENLQLLIEIDKDKKAINLAGDIQTQKYTALHLAAMKGNLECCQLLITAGANPDCGDANKRTALHLAALNGHEHCYQYLLDKSNANYRDNAGKTAAQYKGQTSVVRHKTVKK